MRFKIGSRMYNGASLDRLTLKDILLLEQSTQDLGRPLKWSEIERWTSELDELSKQAAFGKTPAECDAAMRARTDHPGNIWVMAMVIWASRRLAGEQVSFEDAIDFPMGDLEFLPDTKDHLPAGPTKARPRPRKASGRATATPANTPATVT